MLLRGSVTELTTGDRGAHVIVGSHGGVLSGRHAAGCGVASFICHDAGVGLDGAGIEALSVLADAGIPAAAVSYESARIGDAGDMLERGVLSHVNALAAEAGIVPGMAVKAAGQLLEELGAPGGTGAAEAARGEGFARQLLSISTPEGAREVVILDSASSASAKDDGAIIITGSHGGLPGGASTRALKANALLVAFNDAGIGPDGAGTSRLPVLEAAGIAAVCVAAASARIGEGLSTYRTGVISVFNAPARALGAAVGMPLGELVTDVAARRGAGRADAPVQTSFK